MQIVGQCDAEIRENQSFVRGIESQLEAQYPWSTDRIGIELVGLVGLPGNLQRVRLIDRPADGPTGFRIAVDGMRGGQSTLLVIGLSKFCIPSDLLLEVQWMLRGTLFEATLPNLLAILIEQPHDGARKPGS